MGNTSFSDTNTASNSGRIIIQTNKTAYLPGDNISGKIYIHIFSQQPSCELFLNLHGMEATSIFYDVDSRPDKAEREIVNTTWTLYRWESGLSAEHIEIPFSFQLPDNFPPSFHQEGPNFIAHITYKLEAFIKVEGDVEESKIISRVQKLVIRSPNKTPSSYTEEKKVKLTTLGCLPQGYLTLKAHFEKDVLAPGEEARLAIEVDSLHSKIKSKEICFQLTQKTKLNYKFGGKRIYIPVAKSSIPGADARSGSLIKSLVFSVPAFIGDYHNYDKGIDRKNRLEMPFKLTPVLGLITKGSFINSQFYLEVYCKMKGHAAKTPRIRCPIEISYPDPQKQPLHLPGNWNPEVLPMFEGVIQN